MKRRKPLRRVSEKRARALKEYMVLREDYIGEHPRCECGGCYNRSSDIHHREGRGPNLNRTETWMAVCRPCHLRIHNQPSWARLCNYLK